MLQNKLPEFSAPVYDMLSRTKRLLWNHKYPLHLPNQNFTPFFIIGSGRCGSTLLRRMLGASEGIHIPPETYVLGEVCRLYMRNRQMDWKYLVNTVMSVFEFNAEFDKFEIHVAPLVHQLWQLPESERSLAKILDTFYHFHAEQTGHICNMWGDKTPKNTFELDVISKTFPQARYVHLLRDGVDVASSFVTRGLMPNLTEAALLWQNAVLTSRAFMKKYPEQCIEMRYEDLVQNPESELEKLCGFLGIQYQEGMIKTMHHTGDMGDLNAYEHYQKVLEPVSNKNVGLGREQLSASDVNTLKHHIGDTLISLGYEA